MWDEKDKRKPVTLYHYELHDLHQLTIKSQEANSQTLRVFTMREAPPCPRAREYMLLLLLLLRGSCCTRSILQNLISESAAYVRV
uniref:Uncharacterized protein n=1 Tax=Trichogramma kaykai TaxID=54128 RepID=A0ABD2W1C0_9HYME